MDTLDEGAESRNVGGIAEENDGKIGGGKHQQESRAGDTQGRESERKCGMRGRGRERTRKVETTCRNNVRVFDLRHVTEPH